MTAIDVTRAPSPEAPVLAEPDSAEPITRGRGRKPMFDGRKGFIETFMLYVYVIIPFVAVAVAVPFAWSWGGLGWVDVALFLAFYVVSGMGITVGFHRYLTHGAFKAVRPARIALAVAGSLAIEGPVTRWVADHRRHHAFSDRDGDPHSPWRFGTSITALTRGLWWAHMGWLFDIEKTNLVRFAPDLLADRDIRRVNTFFPLIAGISTVLPAVLGGVITQSWWGALTAFFWASLVRIAVLHHVTWSINSICHTIGERPYASRDKSTNFWPLAVLSFGESWHNSHHADPTCARHGVRKGQLDSSARLIWAMEKFGWVSDVRWPRAERFAKLEVASD